MDICNPKILATIAVALIAVGVAVGYLIRYPEVKNLNSTLEHAQQQIESIENMPYLMEMEATSPHIANGTDYSQVRINLWNIYNESLPGKNITLVMYGDEDIKIPFDVEDLGNGTYTAEVNTTLSGIYELVAVTEGGVSAHMYVEFEPGPVETVEPVEFVHPFEERPEFLAAVKFVARDKYGNMVEPPTSNITVVSDKGEFLNVSGDSYGIFTSYITLTEIGDYTITATEKNSGIDTELQFEIPRVYISVPDTIHVNSAINLGIIVFVPYNESPLGYYDFNITFNESGLELMGWHDRNPYDPIPLPNVELVGMNTIRVFQNISEMGIEAMGVVEIINVTFFVTDPGALLFNVKLTNNDPNNLADNTGKPYTSTPVNETKKTDVSAKTVKLKIKIWKVEGQVTDKKVDDDINKLKEILKQCEELCGTKIEVEVKKNTISKNDWKGIDKDNDGYLDEFIEDGKPTSEEKALLDNHFETGYLNVYYVREFDDGSNKGSKTTGEYVTYPDKNKKAVVVDSDDSSKNTLTHEIGHYLGLKHVKDKNNIMYPYKRSTKNKLTKEQCQTIVSNIKMTKIYDWNTNNLQFNIAEYGYKRSTYNAS